VLTLYSYFRGYNPTTEQAGMMYYVVDYSDGLIRRGLIGQIFMLFYSRAQTTQIWAASLDAHLIVAIAIMAGILAWCATLLRQGSNFSTTRLASIYAIFMASQFYPTLAGTNNYVDAYIMLLTLGSFFCASRGHYVLATILAMVAPWIHEISLLFWIPLMLMVFWREGQPALRRPAIWLMLCLPFLSFAALMHFESPAALARQLSRAPVSAAVRNLMARQQFGHHLRGDFQFMLNLYAAHPWRAAVSIIMFWLPTLLIIDLAKPVLPRSALWALILASLAPLAILILEFDLSRFVVNSQFIAMLSILMIAGIRLNSATVQDQEMDRRTLSRVAANVIILLSLPLVYGYFDVTNNHGNAVIKLLSKWVN